MFRASLSSRLPWSSSRPSDAQAPTKSYRDLQWRSSARKAPAASLIVVNDSGASSCSRQVRDGKLGGLRSDDEVCRSLSLTDDVSSCGTAQLVMLRHRSWASSAAIRSTDTGRTLDASNVHLASAWAAKKWTAAEIDVDH